MLAFAKRSKAAKRIIVLALLELFTGAPKETETSSMMHEKKKGLFSASSLLK